LIMKKTTLFAGILFFLVCTTGFTTKKLQREDIGPAWINCDRGILHTCYVEDYYVVDGEPGDTYEWYWEKNQPGRPVVYLNSGPTTAILLSVGDVLILKVNSQYYGEYEYYDTAQPCDE
jgi:hypothetical protein